MRICCSSRAEFIKSSLSKTDVIQLAFRVEVFTPVRREIHPEDRLGQGNLAPSLAVFTSFTHHVSLSGLKTCSNPSLLYLQPLLLSTSIRSVP